MCLHSLERIDNIDSAVHWACPHDDEAARHEGLWFEESTAIGAVRRGRETVLVDLGVHGLEAELDRIVDNGVCPEFDAESRAFSHRRIWGESQKERGAFFIGVADTAHDHDTSP